MTRSGVTKLLTGIVESLLSYKINNLVQIFGKKKPFNLNLLYINPLGKTMLRFKINSQPNDETCGPTCLHAIYRFYHFDISHEEVIRGVQRSHSGGTLIAYLGKHALLHGFKATCYVNNMKLFDPTWFKKGRAPREALLVKLRMQDKYKQAKDFKQASESTQEFLELGGDICFKTIDIPLLKEHFDKRIPILTGLNSTYLYRTSRECFTSEGESFFDDIQGEPCGHFVVLFGYDAKRNSVAVADPYLEEQFAENNYYKVSRARVLNAIMLGVLTYDSALLIIEPKDEEK